MASKRPCVGPCVKFNTAELAPKRIWHGGVVWIDGYLGLSLEPATQGNEDLAVVADLSIFETHGTSNVLYIYIYIYTFF